ncbi:hypothetical protein VIGAN_10120400 [Vigna angularis var. angularis]|uniref:Retrovirus-related Pol polyprotein from transposon TNT 1-94-like beta-barrel domain-containing protein n=1 Tax=Vigna angularis var. angularis TaxID=157739 RepID=A0A0S3T3P3_PHAAN|nr:hypothetical protein VIGAN_10120400 [Vigna angularis var. angularis]
MTPLPKYFSTYSPCPSNKKISTADGTLITAAGQGEIQLSPSMTLKNVLHVPKLLEFKSIRDNFQIYEKLHLFMKSYNQ